MHIVEIVNVVISKTEFSVFRFFFGFSVFFGFLNTDLGFGFFKISRCSVSVSVTDSALTNAAEACVRLLQEM